MIRTIFYCYLGYYCRHIVNFTSIIRSIITRKLLFSKYFSLYTCHIMPPHYNRWKIGIKDLWSLEWIHSLARIYYFCGVCGLALQRNTIINNQLRTSKNHGCLQHRILCACMCLCDPVKGLLHRSGSNLQFNKLLGKNDVCRADRAISHLQINPSCWREQHGTLLRMRVHHLSLWLATCKAMLC